MRDFLPNSHNIHIIKPKQKKPKQKICKKCLSFTTLKDTSIKPHQKVSWCQYYGVPIDPMAKGCKKFR